MGPLKAEGVDRHDLQTPDEARGGVFEYRAVVYNRQRLPSSLAYRSPMAFEQIPVVT